MEYQATFGINCGVSPGLGVKYPDYVERTEKIPADDLTTALASAFEQAKRFADDYLSDPDTGFTTVRLLRLSGTDGEVPFGSKEIVVKRHLLEHLLATP